MTNYKLFLCDSNENVISIECISAIDNTEATKQAKKIFKKNKSKGIKLIEIYKFGFLLPVCESIS
jgi:hypothetical protein